MTGMVGHLVAHPTTVSAAERVLWARPSLQPASSYSFMPVPAQASCRAAITLGAHQLARCHSPLIKGRGLNLKGAAWSSHRTSVCAAAHERAEFTVSFSGPSTSLRSQFEGRGLTPASPRRSCSNSRLAGMDFGRGKCSKGGCAHAGLAACAPVSKTAGQLDLAGQVCIVTGANTGIGLITARELALRGAHVVLACRSEEKGREAAEQVMAEVKKRGAKGTTEVGLLDCSSLSSVRAFAEWFHGRHKQLDCLVCNAGIMVPPHILTKDGFEAQFQVNHLSHFLLTRLLLPTLLEGEQKGEASTELPRVIHVSSLAGERASVQKGEFPSIATRPAETYEAWPQYRLSKLAQCLFTTELNRRYGDKLTVNALHPGIVNTDLFTRNMSPIAKMALAPVAWVSQVTGAAKSPDQGAETSVYLATTSREVTGSGGYFGDSAPRTPNTLMHDVELAKDCWDASSKMVGLEP